jgi:Zn-dependent M32 family carboxypeptidase
MFQIFSFIVFIFISYVARYRSLEKDFKEMQLIVYLHTNKKEDLAEDRLKSLRKVNKAYEKIDLKDKETIRAYGGWKLKNFDIWHTKENDDFLHYVKFEILTFSHLLTNGLTICLF